MRLVALAFLCLSAAFGQVTATLRGKVADPNGAPVEGAIISLSNGLTGYERSVLTAADGAFQFTNVPLQTYTVAIRKDGFQAWEQSAALRSNVPQTIAAQLALATQSTRVDVTVSEFAQTVDAESTGTRTELNASVMSRMPVAPSNRGLEAMLMSSPGFAANANGAIHPRGAHNQMTYVVDGMPISDQLTGAFANAVDPSVVQTIELFTGNVPAEFGNKVSGVAVITTKTGLGAGRKFSGSTQAIGGGFDTLGNVTQVSGGTDRWGYFGSFNALKTNRYLDQVSIGNLHNGGNNQRGFGRVDFLASSHDTLRISVMSGRSSFQLANLRSQHAAGQDQRQALEDASASAGWLHTVDGSTTIDTTVAFRTARSRLIGSPFDTPVTASQDRRLSTWTVGSRWNRLSGRHNWRVGVDVQRYPVREQFTFAITDPVFAADAPLDRFSFNGRRTGGMYSGFVQDTVRLDRFTLTLGLRYDNYRFLVTGTQWQPRVGLAYHLRETNTVLRASYNRTYQTPPNENLLLSSLGREQIRPERQNVYEVGLQQGFGRLLSLNAAYFHKESRDLQDNDNFLNTGIIFPITLAQSRTNGAEARLTLLPVRRFSGSLSITHLRTVVTPPFTGGLFLGNDPAEVFGTSPFIIDHDQPLGAHGLVQYSIRRNLWVSGSVRYDSGLVANPSDPAEVAADPDYADLLPYVNLTSDPARVRPRTITDIAVGYDHYRGDRRAWDATFQVSNLFNVTALYNFQSIFVGTRLVQPRTAAVKLRFWF